MSLCFLFRLPFVTYSNGVWMTTLVNLASKLPRSALRLNSTEVAVEASWLFSSCSTSSSSFSSSPSRNKKINLLSYSYSFTKRWQGIPKTFADCVTIRPSWSDLSILSRHWNAKWNDPPNIWCWCLSDPQPCSSSFSWSLLPLGLTFLRYGKSAKTFLIFYFSLIVIRPPLIIGHCVPPTLLLGRQAFHVESQSSPTVSDLSHLAKVLALPLEFVASIWQILPKQNAALM